MVAVRDSIIETLQRPACSTASRDQNLRPILIPRRGFEAKNLFVVDDRFDFVVKLSTRPKDIHFGFWSRIVLRADVLPNNVSHFNWQFGQVSEILRCHVGQNP
jgi:hypothetical protein